MQREKDIEAHRRNVGTLDAYIRLTGGFTLLALGASGRLGRPWSWLSVLFGASKIAEGMTRYCPMLDAFDISTVQPRRPHEFDQVNREDSDEFEPRTFPWEAGATTPSSSASTNESERQHGYAPQNAGFSYQDGSSGPSETDSSQGPRQARTRRL